MALNIPKTYNNKNLSIIEIYDIDWFGDLNERKSIFGYKFIVARGAISWANKQQTCTTLFMINVKYIVTILARKEAIWLR